MTQPPTAPGRQRGSPRTRCGPRGRERCGIAPPGRRRIGRARRSRHDDRPTSVRELAAVPRSPRPSAARSVGVGGTASPLAIAPSVAAARRPTVTRLHRVAGRPGCRTRTSHPATYGPRDGAGFDAIAGRTWRGSRRGAPGHRWPATATSATSTDARARGRRARRRRRAAVRRAAPPRPPPPLRLPARDRRRARELGGAEGRDARPEGAPPRRARGGPPDRVPRLRGRDPVGRVRRRRRDRVGPRHVGAAPGGTDGPRRGRGRRAAPRAPRLEAARALHAHPHARSATARPTGSSSTSATTTRSRAGTRRTTRSRCSAVGPTTRSRPRRRALWTAGGEQRLDAPLPEFAAPTADELAALDALGAKGTWTFQAHDLALTNLDKVLFPAARRRIAASPSATWSATPRASRRRCCRTSSTGR